MRLALPLLLCLATAACSPPRAPAIPRKGVGDGPLIAGELEDGAAVARALREQYTKYEYRIPMRDGVHLYTVAYVPKNDSRTYPIILQRTPYSVAPYGVDNFPARGRLAPSALFIREGYAIVLQDVRGRMMSEGTFLDVRPHATKKGEIDESTDSWDTVDFLVKNVPSNNGRVGVWGISYPGFYAAQTAVDAHPAIKAISPQAPVTEWFLGDDSHHNGAFFLADTFGFYSNFGRERPKLTRKFWWENRFDTADAYDFFLEMGPVANADTKYLNGEIPFWKDIVAHGDRDEFWKARDPRPFYKNVKAAVLTVGGLFDSEDLWGTFATYRAFEKQSPASAENAIVIGPWSHGGWTGEGEKHGDLNFGAKTGLWYRANIEFPFFQRHLKGRTYAPPAEATVFETGTNTWQQYAHWPPPGAKTQSLFLHAAGKLSASAPAPNEDATGADSYESNPAKPVPYTAKHGPEIDSDYMTADQRFAARRPDVLVYATGDLTADVTLAGPLEASLWVSTTGTDADFVVKLIDVYPNDHAELGGYQQLVRGEVMRGKYRSSFEHPEPFVPGAPTLVKFAVPDTSHTFRTGHRIMVQVQSSWFPLVDRNPQVFTDIYRASESDFHTATHRLFRTPSRPSSLSVTIVRGTLP